MAAAKFTLVREVRVIAGADGPKPTPLLILEEAPAAGHRQLATLGSEFRSALPV